MAEQPQQPRNETTNYQNNILSGQNDNSFKWQLKDNKLIDMFEEDWKEVITADAMTLCLSKLKVLNKNTTLSVLEEQFIKKTSWVSYKNLYLTLFSMGRNKVFKNNINITQNNFTLHLDNLCKDVLELTTSSKFRAKGGKTLTNQKTNILSREDSPTNNPTQEKKSFFGLFKRY
jgi:hypothetical protein